MKVRDITCISDLYYVMGRWFTLVMIAVSVALMPLALDVIDSVVSFLMCGGLAFVGVAADYRDKTIYPVHYISAMVSGACSAVWVWCVCPWWLIAAACLGVVAAMDRHRWLLWCEVGCLVAVAGAMVGDYI